MHACECAAGMDDRLQRVFWGLFVFAAAVPGDASRGVLFVGGQISVLLIMLSYCFHPAFILPPPLSPHSFPPTHTLSSLAERSPAAPRHSFHQFPAFLSLRHLTTRRLHPPHPAPVHRSDPITSRRHVL